MGDSGDCIKFRCPGCGRDFSVPRSMQGSKCRCRGYFETVVVPTVSDTAASGRIVFSCQSNGRRFDVPVSMVGTKNRCLTSEAIVVVPNDSNNAPSADSANSSQPSGPSPEDALADLIADELPNLEQAAAAEGGTGLLPRPPVELLVELAEIKAQIQVLRKAIRSGQQKVSAVQKAASKVERAEKSPGNEIGRHLGAMLILFVFELLAVGLLLRLVLFARIPDSPKLSE